MKIQKYIINGKQHSLTLKTLYIIIFFSTILSIFFILGKKIVFNGFVYSGYRENYLLDFQYTDLLLFLALIIIFSIMIISILYCTKNLILIKRNQQDKDNTYVIYIFSFILFLSWSPYILSFAPGSVLGDSLSSVGQVLQNYQNMNNHHPIIYTLFVGAFIDIGIKLGNINYGIFIYTLVQSGIMVFVIAILLQCLYKYGIPRSLMSLFIIYYAVMPFFPSYAIIMWKDPLYSCGLLMLLLFSLEIYQTNGLACCQKKCLIYFSISAILCLFRNNGIYVLIADIIAMLLLYRNKVKKIIITGSIIVTIYLLTNTLLFSVFHIEKDFEENIGILLQQIARVIAYHGEMSENEKDFLFHILPEEQWEQNYHPCLVDSIKWNAEFDVTFLEKNKKEFISIWFSLLKKNLKLYVDAYILNTFGFWTIGTWNGYGYIDIYISDNNYGIKNTDLFEKLTKSSIQENLKSFLPQIGEGWFIWIMLISLCLCACKSLKSILIYIPPVVNWITILIATPVAFSLRYVYICALALPIIIVLPFIITLKKDEMQSI